MARKKQNIIITGAQWGDEGKGKSVDALAAEADVIVRHQGGANSGHTLVVGEKPLALHLIPCGLLHRDKVCIVGIAELCDLEVLRDELMIANEHGSIVMIDWSAPAVLPIHKLLDRAREARAAGNKIGTTGRGIGPAVQHLFGRNGIKMGDLTKRKKLEEAIALCGYDELVVLAQHLGVDNAEIPTAHQTIEWLMSFSGLFRPYMADTRMVVKDARAAGKRILFEGAQAVLLDPIQGSPPHTTSSLCTPAMVQATYGGNFEDFESIGVAKAYATRVGGGPFPTEQDSRIGSLLRERGGEYGATTQRPRRCGWLDLVALRYACGMGIEKIVLTKLDVLSGFTEIPVAVGYQFKGSRLETNASLTPKVLRDSGIVYKIFPGWQESLQGRTWAEFPEAAKHYVRFISKFIGIPVSTIGVGPKREDLVPVPLAA